MTHNPAPVPPPPHWPVPDGPDCPSCEATGADIQWQGTAVSFDTSATVHLWLCGSCCGEWMIPVTTWPVLDGPDCPVCESPVTRWTGIDPDHLGDAWTCEAGHEFVLDPEGFVFVPDARNGGTC